MAEITSLREAVAGLVHDGDTVAMEGFTHLILADLDGDNRQAATVARGPGWPREMIAKGS